MPTKNLSSSGSPDHDAVDHGQDVEATAGEPKPGRNSPDSGGSAYQKNSPDEFSSRVPDPLERRERETLGPQHADFVRADDSGERPGPDKRDDVDESGM